MAPFKNVLLVGAGGSIGNPVLSALAAEPSLSVTVLKRESSRAEIPPHVPSITIPDSYPTDELVAAFTGFDVIVNCMAGRGILDQLRFIDAAIVAGVRRYVPSEYGLNNMRPEAQALNQTFRDKGKVQTYLRSKQDEIEWTTISCGMWLKWCLQNDFLGIHYKERKFVITDEGDGFFSCTSEENTVAALINALLKKPEETKNKNVMVSEFATTQRELLAELEKQTGEKWTVEKQDSKTAIPKLQAAYAAGETTAVYGLIEIGFVSGRYGGHLEKEGEIMTETLGLKRSTLKETIAEALAAYPRK